MAVPEAWESVLREFLDSAPIYRWRLNVWRVERPEDGQPRMRAVTRGESALSANDERAAEQLLGAAAARAGGMLLSSGAGNLNRIPAAVLDDIRDAPAPELKWLFAVPYLLGIKAKKMTGFLNCPEVSDGDEIEFAMENAFSASAAAIRHLFDGNAPVKRAPIRRLIVDISRDRATLDETPFQINVNAALYLKSLVDADGEWVGDWEEKGLRPDKIKPKLPKEIRALIEAETGKGQRIPREKLYLADRV